VSLVGVAAPAFWIALLLVQWLAVGQGLFPTSGYVSLNDSFTGWLKSLTLPAVALAADVRFGTSMFERVGEQFVADDAQGKDNLGSEMQIILGRDRELDPGAGLQRGAQAFEQSGKLNLIELRRDLENLVDIGESHTETIGLLPYA